MEKNAVGFELLNKIYHEELNSKEDVLVLLIHSFLLRKCFKCVGTGDSKILEDEEVASELLPDGWNQTYNLNYTLRYVQDGKLLVLTAVKSEKHLLLNFLRVDDYKVCNLKLELAKVESWQGSLESMIPGYLEILELLSSQVVLSPDRTDMSTQTPNFDSNGSNRDISDDPLRVSHDVDLMERRDFWHYSNF